MKNGWKPVENLSAYEEIGTTARYFRDLGYLEADDCTGGGTLACIFYFKNDNGQYLKIGTRGEYPDPIYDVQTKIVYADVIDKISD